MSRVLILTAALLLVAACARVVDSDFHADGTQQHTIACGYGVAGSICAAKAKEICPGGFDVKMITTHIDGDRMVIACPSPPHHFRFSSRFAHPAMNRITTITDDGCSA